MATVSQPLGHAEHRPNSTGVWAWITTVDHKKIGLLYLLAGFIFFLAGGVEALLIRLQLAAPGNTFLTGDKYNQVLTMHGTTMIFLAAMPIIAAFMNYMMPILIGARDVAFPRMNALSFWTFLAGGLVLNASWFLGGAPDAGWFNYANLSSGGIYNPGIGVDFYLVGLQLTGIGSLVSSVNFLVTILTMRAPGMKLMDMPPFAWATFFTSIILLFSLPAFTVAMLLLMMDRWVGTGFYVPAMGGDVLLWQHLFWIFGHPEVYVLGVPAFGLVSEVIPVFSRKPLFGYKTMVTAMSLITGLAFIVWVHHMFTVGSGPWVNTVFAITTKAISVPTGLLVFNWIFTMWGGKIRFTTSMLFAVGFLTVFVLGGLSGIVNATAPLNPQLQDTYWVVAHFHYVAIGGVLFSLLAAAAYWWPKISGRMLSEKLGKLSFWVTFIGFNVTFGPMHLSGLMGMPRRIYTYAPQLQVGEWNMLSTIGAFTLGLGVLIYGINVITSLRSAAAAGKDPWDARTLEWTTPSPVPEYNFAQLPQVRGRDALWFEKQNGNGKMRYAKEEGHGIHMPNPSYMPALISLGLMIASFGGVYRAWIVGILGLAVTAAGMFGWIFENDEGYHIEAEEGHS